MSSSTSRSSTSVDKTDQSITSSQKGTYCCLVSVSAVKPKQPVIVLSSNKLTVGRSQDVDVCLRSGVISRLHAILSKSTDNSNAWSICDNESLNGVFINSQQIPPTVSTVLNDGDIIQFGVSVQKHVEAEFIYKFCQQRSIRMVKKRKRDNESNDNHNHKVFVQPVDADQVDGAPRANDRFSRIILPVSDSDDTDTNTSRDTFRNQISGQTERYKKHIAVTAVSSSIHKVHKPQTSRSFVESLVSGSVASSSLSTATPVITATVTGATVTPLISAEPTKLPSQISIVSSNSVTTPESPASDAKQSKKKVVEMKLLLDEKDSKMKEITDTLENERKRTEQQEKELLEMKQKQKELMDKIEAKKNKKKKKCKKKEKEKKKDEKNNASVINVMESEFNCSICSEMFIKATTLNCSHSFCELCINQWCKKKKECPICRAAIKSRTRSLVLDNFIDSMVASNPELVDLRKQLTEERNKQEQATPKSPERARPQTTVPQPWHPAPSTSTRPLLMPHLFAFNNNDTADGNLWPPQFLSNTFHHTYNNNSNLQLRPPASTIVNLPLAPVVNPVFNPRINPPVIRLGRFVPSVPQPLQLRDNPLPIPFANLPTRVNQPFDPYALDPLAHDPQPRIIDDPQNYYESQSNSSDSEGSEYLAHLYQQSLNNPQPDSDHGDNHHDDDTGYEDSNAGDADEPEIIEDVEVDAYGEPVEYDEAYLEREPDNPYDDPTFVDDELEFEPVEYNYISDDGEYEGDLGDGDDIESVEYIDDSGPEVIDDDNDYNNDEPDGNDYNDVDNDNDIYDVDFDNNHVDNDNPDHDDDDVQNDIYDNHDNVDDNACGQSSPDRYDSPNHSPGHSSNDSALSGDLVTGSPGGSSDGYGPYNDRAVAGGDERGTSVSDSSAVLDDIHGVSVDDEDEEEEYDTEDEEEEEDFWATCTNCGGMHRTRDCDY